MRTLPGAVPALLILTLVLSACGGGGGADTVQPSSVTIASGAKATALTLVSPEASGSHCAAGGSRIDIGADSNGDGRLGEGEVTSTQYACNGATGAAGAAGAPGSSGLNTLVSVNAEAAGANCSTGGNKIEAGLDHNGNGALGTDEVASTQYVCHGATGATGATGSSGATGPAGASGATGATGATGSQGLSALVQMISEPGGANCAAGGKKINVGMDANANQVLEASEISSTAYVCNGVDGLNGTNGTNGLNGANGTNGTNGVNGSAGLTTLLNIVAEPAGANCAYGGSKVGSGLDANANGLLEAGEVSASSYVCNGAPGSNGGMSWTVSANAVQAQANSGYITTNDNAPVVVTLPTSPIIGDTLRISGVGQGGWTLAQNANQLVSTKNLGGAAGLSWTARDDSRAWRAVASSADGTKLVAVVNMGQIYTSTDSGANWVARDATRNWYAVTSSADGTKLAAVAYGDKIYTSTDSGISWTARETARNWTAIASSADGAKLVATVKTGFTYTSTDSGIIWMQRATSLAWQAVASSADGMKLVGVVTSGTIWSSTTGGTAWTTRESARNWQSVASSSDGVKLVAVVQGGFVYTSTDSGVTWVPRESTRNWQSVASSADGTKLVAVVYNGQIYGSADSGVTWTARGTVRDWQAVASSADGTKLASMVSPGQAYTSIPTTSLGNSGYLRGNQYDAIELQYLGSGVFGVLSHEGSLVAY